MNLLRLFHRDGREALVDELTQGYFRKHGFVERHELDAPQPAADDAKAGAPADAGRPRRATPGDQKP